MANIRDRKTCVLYTTAVCNLNCSYCYIDKNPALKRIDDMLDKSFEGDYYFDFIREMFPNIGQLETIEVWGGEPFLRMDRIYHTLHRVIGHYPFFRTIFASTNHAFDGWVDQVLGLAQQFGKYPDRDFTFSLQLSVDGPPEIQDKNRGAGVAEKCEKNFRELLARVGDTLPGNVTLIMHHKPTLTLETIRMLSNKQAIRDYYTYFDNLIHEVRALGFTNVQMMPNLPNTAQPIPAAREDGEMFAQFCRLCRELELENKETKFVQYYDHFLPHRRFYVPYGPTSYRYRDFTCGTGHTVVGLLPGRIVSACHNGFVDLVGEYKKLSTANEGRTVIDPSMFFSQAPTRFAIPQMEYPAYERHMGHFAKNGTSARLAGITAQILMLAMTGQVDEKYIDEKEALQAAIFYQSHMSFCVRDNYAVTGSVSTVPLGMLRLFLNGAKDVIEQAELEERDDACNCHDHEAASGEAN